MFRSLLFVAVICVGLAFASSADAGWGCRTGYSSYGYRGGYSSYPVQATYYRGGYGGYGGGFYGRPSISPFYGAPGGYYGGYYGGYRGFGYGGGIGYGGYGY